MHDRKRLTNIVGGSAGNLVEWFDWYVYAAFALYFAPSFFPKGDQTAQLLQTAAIFAVGFVVRPIGAWAMGIVTSLFAAVIPARAAAYVQERAMKNEYVTGLIHVDTSRRDFHEQHATSETALNAVPFERLCPGSAKLGKILSAFR